MIKFIVAGLLVWSIVVPLELIYHYRHPTHFWHGPKHKVSNCIPLYNQTGLECCRPVTTKKG